MRVVLGLSLIGLTGFVAQAPKLFYRNVTWYLVLCEEYALNTTEANYAVKHGSESGYCDALGYDQFLDNANIRLGTSDFVVWGTHHHMTTDGMKGKKEF